MESSEEDAGNATSASCRASAREKDVGLAEDVEPTRNVQHESSEARASCRTPAMSEYNFDGDSVPSPSTKDTSTEAILDMIDDFIDGPGASRRLPLEIQTTAYDPVTTPGKSAPVHLDSQCESEEQKAEITVPPKELTLAVGSDGESFSESICLLAAEPQKSPNSETFICANTSNSIALPQASSFIQVGIAELSSSQPNLERITCTSNAAAPEGLSEQHVLDTYSSNIIPEQLFMHPVLSASKSEVITEQPVITPLNNSVESKVSTEQPAEAPSFTSVEPKVSTEQLAIASSFGSVGPDVSTKQPVIASSSSSVELVVLPKLPVMAPLCSSVEGDVLTVLPVTVPTSTSVEPEVLIEQPVLASVPENTEPFEITETFVIVPSSSSTEPEVPTDQSADTASSSSEPTSLENPIITPLPSSVEPETVPEQVSLCNVDSGVPIEQCVISPLLGSTETETLPESVIAPTSSSVETVQVLTDTSECENVKRTVKCTTSSENRDNVTVELAESTSSECSVSESRPFSMEPTSRSPLKRRLIRPVPSDRRPDSTVSSTVDSLTLDILTTEQTSCEIITKDVSSSSDAVPHDDDSTKPVEISNVSEISICKAETSTAPLRKIKLVRPKVTPLINYSVKSDVQTSPIALEKDQCQSTSSDDNSMLSSAQLSVETCNRVSLVKFEDQVRVPSTDDIAEEHPALEILEQAKDVSNNELLEKKSEVIETYKKMVSEPTTSKFAPSTVEILSANTQLRDLKKHTHNDDEILLDMKKVSPIKLSLSGAKPLESKINVNHSESQNMNSDLKNSPNPSQDENKSSLLVVQDLLSDVPETKCDLQSKQAEHSTNVIFSKNDHKKSPSIKLSLSNAEHSSELTSGVKKSKTVEEVSVSHKLEESKQVPKLTIKLTNKHNEEVKSPVPKLTIKHLQSPVEKSMDDIDKQASSVTKINAKQIHSQSEKVNELDLSQVNELKLSQLKEQCHNTHTNQQIPNVSKLNIKPRSEMDRSATELTFESVTPPLSTTSELNTDDTDYRQQTPCVTKINIKPILKPNESVIKPADQNLDDFDKLPPSSITKINIKPTENEGEAILLQPIAEQTNDEHEINHQIPTVTKINIKPIPKPTEKSGECQSKTLRSIMNQNADDIDTKHQIPSVAKINIKPVLKPAEKVTDGLPKSHLEIHQNDLLIGGNKHIPNVTKLNIKPIPKPPEKINVTQRKSSSSEISESEYSENDESTSTSDQASASDQGSLGTVPKVTIKLGKPGTESEGKFYTEKNIPKLTIKNIQHSDKDDQDKLKLIISQSADKQHEKVPKITIKTVSNVNPKLTIKPLKSPESVNKDNEIPKFKISPELFSSSADVKENQHVPKITIKPVTKTDTDGTKIPKKTPVMCDSAEHIPVVTKLNIKPILKPTEAGQSSESFDDKVPVVSKLNIKPIIKPKDNEVDCSVEDVPKVIKLNIKPLKNPEESTSEEKDCDEKNADMKDNTSIPVVTKLNIKPIVKPVESKALKDSENQLSETGNSSDDNADHIPMVTKLNIKPIVKPSELGEAGNLVHNDQNIPVVTKLNIKPLVKPEDSSLLSPKKESSKSPGSAGIPVLTKLNIKPIVKPDDSHNKTKDENTEKLSKNPSLVMKINKRNAIDKPSENEHLCNNVSGKANSPKLPNFSKGTKRSTAKESNADQSSKPKMPRLVEASKNVDCNPGSPSLLSTDCESLFDNSRDCCVAPENVSTSISNELHTLSKDQTLSKTVCTDKTVPEKFVQETVPKVEQLPLPDNKANKKKSSQINEPYEANKLVEHCNINCTKPSIQNYTLLKKLLSATKEDNIKVTEPVTLNCLSQSEKSELTLRNCNDTRKTEEPQESQIKFSPKLEKPSSDSIQMHSFHDIHKEVNESVTKPLEIITDKFTNQGSGQDSPRIILKINKTDHGASAKIITEDSHKSADSSPSNESHGTEHAPHEPVNDIPSPKKHLANSRRKPNQPGTPINMTMGKRLRSSRIVESAEKSPAVKRNVTKRPPTTETSSTTHRESEQSDFEIKKIKLEQLLSVNKSLTITPVASKVTQTSPSKSNTSLKQPGKVSHNHSLLKNENCSQKNGNSKLHNILSNLHTKQMQTLQLNENKSEKAVEVTPEVESNTSTTSSDVVEITRVENCHPEVQEMIINENSVCDLTGNDEVSQDPLEVENTKPVQEEVKEIASISTIELTPTPRKRGRPRKLPLSEGAKPPTPAPLPVPALEERPQRSLRLMREKPAILKKPRGRGRGRGRGGRRPAVIPPPEPEPEPEPAPELEPEPQPEPVVAVDLVEARAPSPIDPTSSRIKLPRMTEALDKSVAGCATPLTSRRRSSTASSDLKLFRTGPHPDLESPEKAEFMKSPEATRPKSGRGSRGGRIRTPRNRGRGRGGGRGAMYMKETMGIYGRVCGPATTTVQLFEEETCMMDDNATPSKPSHLLDEDSQSSVKSSTNDSNKMKKSKFADLFDSNKVWTAADVKEYTWPPPDTPAEEPQVMMIQEQVAMFLGVKSFKRRYPELKRRPVSGEEREYVLSKGVVSEALCDLGITAVDASEVLDIMLSDYPHKYEEYRTHQRERHIASLSEETSESKPEEKPTKIEIKVEKPSEKPEPPKVDPEKTRQDMAAAAIASAAEWNARANALRRPACVDLQSMTIHRRRPPPPPAPPPCVRPAVGFYPHALLPGQFQHWYRTYTAEQLRYFPLNTVLAAPPAPPSPTESSSESEGSWGEHSSSSDESDAPHQHSAKRKKLSRVKRSSQHDKDKEDSRGPEVEVETCRVCKLRLEANRKYTHERFLVCANCNAKLHPGCVELAADTIRKCREYAWQCAECKSCCACRKPQDDDKMLFCDLCDRGFHIYCVGLDAVPSGRWHCVECAICKSCGARDPNGLTPVVPPTPGPSTPGLNTPGPSTPGPSTPGPSTPGVSVGPGEWHHQTRRGPGGHKVYSHSLCTPCARAYRIGRYCPLCDRSFIGPKGTMQLVICKLCDRQLHQECVRATVAHLKVLDYTCADCRRGGITSRAAAVRVAPRTIATLFMAKRRFNKYAHRQYLQSRLAAAQDADTPPDADAPPDADECSVDPLEGVGADPPPPPTAEDSGD